MYTKVKHEGPGWVMFHSWNGLAQKRDVAKLLPVLMRLGIPWMVYRHGPEDWFGWDGKALRFNECPSDLFHELGHWQCANPKLRRLADFGIGAHRIQPYVPHGPAKYPDDEESMASLLGILLERALGQPWADTFNEHNWRGKYCGGGVKETLDMLAQAGLVRDMTPTCLLPQALLPAGAR